MIITKHSWLFSYRSISFNQRCLILFLLPTSLLPKEACSQKFKYLNPYDCTKTRSFSNNQEKHMSKSTPGQEGKKRNFLAREEKTLILFLQTSQTKFQPRNLIHLWPYKATSNHISPEISVISEQTRISHLLHSPDQTKLLPTEQLHSYHKACFDHIKASVVIMFRLQF